MPTIVVPTEAEMLRLGLSLVGFGEKRQGVSPKLNISRFRAHYGIGPKATSKMLADLRKSYPGANGVDYFMMLNFWKGYDVEHVLSGRWGLCEETARTRLWAVEG